MHSNINHVTDAETVDSRRNWLYKIGGAAALLVVMILPIQIIVYIVSRHRATAFAAGRAGSIRRELQDKGLPTCMDR